ncbi:tRNA (adenosine(37)-N6)-dimethylallyltransferase MiaA [Plantibacter sp. Mn2098]|uniref:tRNA (adenosine(37)-N6)-dimethylallyltransferase MiaA n=1 Tax=Plantibacter sp. Mn2098 TaxID=3395266 RepID=UPI003BC3A6B8
MTLIAVVGATGTGKSELSLDLAERIASGGGRAEIVNVDAMQLYRGMDIGTAKLPLADRRGVPHHLFDVLDVTEEATVAWYQPRARRTVEEIIERGATPILVGGSGLYVSSVVYDFRFPARDQTIRDRLEHELERDGVAAMFARLRVADPATAERVDRANGRRVVRAMEVYELAEAGHGAMLPETPVPWLPVSIIGLSAPRPDLVERLDARVGRMWADGIVAETEQLLKQGLDDGVTAKRAIGYAQASAQILGELSEAEAIAETQRLTRRYARRQVSWFKRYPDVTWIDSADSDRVDIAAGAAGLPG